MQISQSVDFVQSITYIVAALNILNLDYPDRLQRFFQFLHSHVGCATKTCGESGADTVSSYLFQVIKTSFQY